VKTELLGHHGITLDFLFVIAAFMAHLGKFVLEAAALTLQRVQILEYRQGFFKERYSRLGWVLKTPILKQAIRVNKTVAKTPDFLRRMGKAGVTLEKVPFLDNGYWVEKSRVSVGATAEYLLGLYSIQEAAAQIPANFLTKTAVYTTNSITNAMRVLLLRQWEATNQRPIASRIAELHRERGRDARAPHASISLWRTNPRSREF
jgi:hypothetical protein